MGQKIHTLRLNYFHWEKIVKQMGAGESCLQLRQWEDKPYRSPQRLLGVYTTPLGIEKLFRHQGEWWSISNEDKLTPIDAEKLAKNDGLSLQDFEAWFKHYKGQELIACLHFTPLRYHNQ